MSKLNFVDGINFNSDQKGLLSVDEDRLSTLIKKEPISNVYHVEHTPFARGKFAAVRKCTHRVTGVDYAAKFIRKRRRAMDQRGDILHEIAVLQAAAGSARIVTLHEVYETAAEMALVLELAAGGELQRVLDEQEGLGESQAVRVMKQILEGLSFLHERNIAHLDLKPQNMLLTADYPECDVKLCDFGISRVIQSGVEVREILGTPDYVAPEILSYEPISLATDIWSVGVLTYVLLSGFSPFGGESKQETFCNISQCKLSFPDELFEGVSDPAKDFVRATLHTNPRLRLTISECLSHPWLTGLCPSSSETVSHEVEIANINQSDTNCGMSRSSETDVHLFNGVNRSPKSDVNSTNIPHSPLSNGSCKPDTNENSTSSTDIAEFSRLDSTETANNHFSNVISIPLINPTKITLDTIPNGNNVSSTEEDEDSDLPLQKRPKNCATGRRASFPIASCLSCAQCGTQCCHHPHTPPRSSPHQHAGITNSPVEITLYRGIIC